MYSDPHYYDIHKLFVVYHAGNEKAFHLIILGGCPGRSESFTGLTCLCCCLVMRKPVHRVSDQVRHKWGCTTKEDGQRLEISNLGGRGIVLSM